MSLSALRIAAVISGACLAAAGTAVAAPVEPKTVITGAQMEITSGGSRVIFSGGARVSKGADSLTAERIVQDKNKNRVDAQGEVVFMTVTQDGEPFTGTSGKAYYDMANGRGELTGGKPEIIYHVKTSTSPVSLKADRISFDTGREELRGKDNVEIITSSVTAYAPNAVFMQKEKKIILTGPDPQPLVIYRQGMKPSTYSADSITFLSGGDRILLQGNVKAVMNVEDRETGTKGK